VALAAWVVVGEAATVVWWFAPVSARNVIVAAIATRTPIVAAAVPGLIRNRGVSGPMGCDVNMACSVLVWAAGAAWRLDGSSELGEGTVTSEACSGLTARLQLACGSLTVWVLAEPPAGW
jgi:hypothetical protein